MPPAYVSALAKLGVTTAGGFPFPEWSPDRALAMLDRYGIATAITSISCPGVYFGDKTRGRELARRCNEEAAGLVSRWPARFGGFACLPLPDVEGCLRETEYALDQLGLDGVVLLASAGGRYLGDPELDDLFSELDRRQTVVFVHPNVPPGSQALGLSFPPAILEFTFDTTRAIANLIYSGTLERCQQLRLIVAHAGGTVPFLAWRMSLLDRVPGFMEHAPEGGMHYLRGLYYDTAMSANRHGMGPLLDLADPSRVLFATDFPFMPDPVIEKGLAHLRDDSGLDAERLAAIERENALRLFPRLAAG